MAIKKTKKEVKKLFISCPMTGREQKAIDNSFDRMHKIAEAVFDQKLEVINTYKKIPTDIAGVDIMEDVRGKAFMLGAAYMDISKADYYIGVYPLNYYSSGMHNSLADDIGMPMYLVDPCKIAPDAVEWASNMFVKECFEEVAAEIEVEFKDDPYDI